MSYDQEGFAVYAGVALPLVTDQLREAHELIAKLEKEHAEEIEHTKEQFFTNISHELRTPISLILPPIHEMQKKQDLDEQGKTLINLAERNSLRLLRLVNPTGIIPLS